MRGWGKLGNLAKLSKKFRQMRQNRQIRQGHFILKTSTVLSFLTFSSSPLIWILQTNHPQLVVLFQVFWVKSNDFVFKDVWLSEELIWNFCFSDSKVNQSLCDIVCKTFFLIDYLVQTVILQNWRYHLSPKNTCLLTGFCRLFVVRRKWVKHINNFVKLWIWEMD